MRKTNSSILKVYGKKSCGSCKKAWGFLNKKKVEFENFDIVQTPPTRSVLEKVVSGKDVKSSLNPKCKTYKEKKLSKRTLTKTEAIRMMIDDPNLIRRPLFVLGDKYLQGFDESAVKEIIEQ
ncbi:MAG: Spx/MgsR family RNA polymerase-binding regulatory protein [Deltaproteobacteria bacterium]|nr:Spx/MgsR family RNA polymerase-binding regulatory protein [Deltaproteobacteria bacterium]